MQIRYLGDMRYELICKDRNVLASSWEGKDSLLSHQGSPMRTKGMKGGDKTVKKRKVAFRMEEEESGRDKSQWKGEAAKNILSSSRYIKPHPCGKAINIIIMTFEWMWVVSWTPSCVFKWMSSISYHLCHLHVFTHESDNLFPLNTILSGLFYLFWLLLDLFC